MLKVMEITCSKQLITFVKNVLPLVPDVASATFEKQVSLMKPV
jgi:hypothetical protein